MSGTTSRYRPPAQQRGEETRLRLLDAALELFAKDGFEGTSTRALADKAGANLPAIQYYFGSKEGLYRAVVDGIIAEIEAAVTPLAEEIRTRLADSNTTRADLIDLLCQMLATVVALMLDENVPNRESRQKFFARMEAESDAAFDAFQASVFRNVFDPCRSIVGRLLDQAPTGEQATLRTLTLIGQAKMFCGRNIPGILGWERIGEDQVRAVQQVICGQVRAIFGNPPA